MGFNITQGGSALFLEIGFQIAVTHVSSLVMPLYTWAVTLQMLFSETSTFLAAMSRWTKPFRDKYCSPTAICCEKFSSVFGVCGETSSPGLYGKK